MALKLDFEQIRLGWVRLKNLPRFRARCFAMDLRVVVASGGPLSGREGPRAIRDFPPGFAGWRQPLEQRFPARAARVPTIRSDQVMDAHCVALQECLSEPVAG
jgi:hypothetical protein